MDSWQRATYRFRDCGVKLIQGYNNNEDNFYKNKEAGPNTDEEDKLKV